MSIFNSVGKPANPQQAMERLKENPASVLKQAGLNIPANMTDPQAIVMHLIQTGQLPRNRLQQIAQMTARR